MSHYNSYDSFNLRKSKEKKMQAKSKLTKYQDGFILKSAQDYGVVVEVKYHEAFVYYKGEIVLASMQKNLNLPMIRTKKILKLQKISLTSMMI